MPESAKLSLLLRQLSPALLALACLGVQATDTTIPAAEFARLPVVSNFKLSPSGKYYAAYGTVNGRPGIITSDLQGTERAVSSASKSFVTGFEWANDDRLIITIRATDAVNGNLVNLTRLISSDRGLKERLMLKMDPNSQGLYRQYPEVVSMLKHDPQHILASLDDSDQSWAAPEVHRVNLYSGKRKRVQRNNRSIYEWLADHDGQLRLGVSFDRKASGARGRTQTVYYRETEDSPWEVLQEADYFDNERLYPWSFDEDDPNILLVSNREISSHYPQDGKTHVYRYDLTQRKILGRKEFPQYQAIAREVARRFPGQRFTVDSRDESRRYFTLHVSSDVSPPEHYLYIAQNQSLHLLGREYEHLQDQPMAPMQVKQYTARDGLEIPAFLTLPVNKKPQLLPLIVYPHGGPWTRDHWGFDNYVQFFASRGYAVLQPQFRGSTGYGIEHETAGYGQWGLAIQDDISDGVQWLVGKGIADPDRVCIVGSSFGGYAAAMGLVKTPELYRCAIAINAVLDLPNFIEDSRIMLFREIRRAMWNPLADAKKASPYDRRDEIAAPLLLIASEDDTIVPYKEHSRALYRKLKRRKHDVELVVLEDGEHWRTSEKLEQQKLEAIEAFLKRVNNTEEPTTSKL